jgi:hypothetical protein
MSAVLLERFRVVFFAEDAFSSSTLTDDAETVRLISLTSLGILVMLVVGQGRLIIVEAAW